MPAEIDIIVSSPDSTDVRLVVETKLALRDFNSAESNLRNSMWQLSCPLGLLITPDKMWVYSDSFLSAGPESMEKIGEFGIEDLLSFDKKDNSPQEARRFESYVQRWIEVLPQLATDKKLTDSALKEILQKYLVPAIEFGDVRAAGPRY
jgi:hypothetical protein